MISAEFEHLIYSLGIYHCQLTLPFEGLSVKSLQWVDSQCAKDWVILNYLQYLFLHKCLSATSFSNAASQQALVSVVQQFFAVCCLVQPCNGCNGCVPCSEAMSDRNPWWVLCVTPVALCVFLQPLLAEISLKTWALAVILPRVSEYKQDFVALLSESQFCLLIKCNLLGLRMSGDSECCPSSSDSWDVIKRF